MSGSIDSAFVLQYQSEVKEAYQRQGSKLRPTVRSKTGVRGARAVFQKVGRGTAVNKTRHSTINVMTLARDSEECILEDFYAADWIDRLDELKINHDERAVIANAGAYALGRKTDELIITALNSAPVTRNAGLNTDGLTKAKVLTAFELLGTADVPDDGNRYAVVGWKQWSELLGIPEFATSDYVGEDQLPWKGAQAKRWLGALWMPHSGLTTIPVGPNFARQCYFYHKTAVAHAVAAEISTDITWHGDRAAYFVNTMMSQGAVLVDETGVVRMNARE